MAHVFGPVPSRRLGRSLGVDLVPLKTCTYDCVYCQLGRTTNRTLERKEWTPLGPVLTELRSRLDTQPDYVTLSGSGEPTLYSRLGELIEGIRSMTAVPIAVLTNGSLFWDQEVRRGILSADVVMPSLDAGDQASFEAVNRPHPGISFEQMLDGLVSFREEFDGAYWLEVFLLQGQTAEPSEVGKIAECVRRIKPDKVQLNTVTRPPAEDYAAATSMDQLEQLARLFEPRAEVIADFAGVHAHESFAATRETVLQLLRRRPCSIDDIAGGLGIHHNEAIKYVTELLRLQAIERVATGAKVFFRSKD